MPGCAADHVCLIHTAPRQVRYCTIGISLNLSPRPWKAISSCSDRWQFCIAEGYIHPSRVSHSVCCKQHWFPSCQNAEPGLTGKLSVTVSINHSCICPALPVSLPSVAGKCVRPCVLHDAHTYSAPHRRALKSGERNWQSSGPVPVDWMKGYDCRLWGALDRLFPQWRSGSCWTPPVGLPSLIKKTLRTF